MDWEIFVVLVCAALSFVFSASETALTSLGRLEIQSLMAQGGGSSRLLQVWVREPGRVLITVLVGNNIVNIGASSLMALWADHKYPHRVTIVMGAFTLVHIVLSEIIPKMFARIFSMQISPWALKFLRLAWIVLFPIVIVFQKISTSVVLLSGMTGRETRKPFTEEELTQTIEMATKDGGIDRETGEVLSNLIEFPDRLARDVMTPRGKAQALNVKWTLDEVARFIVQDGHSRYPVIRANFDDLVGVVLVKDIMAYIQNPAKGSWTRVIRRPFFISELAPLGTVLRDMRKWGTHLALVRDENGIVTGLLTLEDLIEEIVGDIRDEHDDPAPNNSSTIAMGGPRLVNGEISILDFNQRFQASLPLDGVYSTLNGYILAKTGGNIPPVGTLIFGEEFTFRIHSVADTGVATVELIDQSSGNHYAED